MHLMVVSVTICKMLRILINYLPTYQLLVSALAGSHVKGDLEPPPGVPAFIRSAVEQRPPVSPRPISPFFMKQNLELSSEFGSMSLPLRSAVESIPSVK